MERFEYIWKAPRGHKFFEDNTNGRLAIADDSGDRPDQTDDGVLWVDQRRPVRETRDGSMLLPLLHEDGSQSATPADANEVLWVAARLGMVVHTRSGMMFRVEAL
jgi:hypothetical protein